MSLISMLSSANKKVFFIKYINKYIMRIYYLDLFFYFFMFKIKIKSRPFND